jgi:glycosyltransferase involved in cell wall biosynthesis
MKSHKLAIIGSHPIQYYAPWFKYLAGQAQLQLKVFYLWDFGIVRKIDAGFRSAFQWDVPLLEGYEYEFLPNVSKDPGTQHLGGLNNPGLFERVSAYGPDVVLLLGYNYLTYYHFLWQWRRQKAPLLFRGDSHRLMPRSGAGEALKRNFISFVYSRFSAILYVGKANYEYFRYHRVPAEKLFLSPHAVDNERFFKQEAAARIAATSWKRELGIPEGHKVILFAGKFQEKKRPQDLVEAFLASGVTDKASLLLVGSGEWESRLRERAAKGRNIYFAPFQNQTQMPRAYAAGDLFVLPSYGPGETWGLSINEAMCMERPVIASSHVGCAQDLVFPKKNGLIFPAGDVRALAACLKLAFSEQVDLKVWGTEGRSVIEGFSYEKAARGLLEAVDYLKKE